MKKITQGIWKADMNPFYAKGTDVRFAIVSDEYASDISVAYGRSIEESEANAKLIAAAPDLLNACIAALELSDKDLEEKYEGRSEECQAVYDIVKAAIKKATE